MFADTGRLQEFNLPLQFVGACYSDKLTPAIFRTGSSYDGTYALCIHRITIKRDASKFTALTQALRRPTQ
jgi:hypothetical protein